MIDRDSFIMTFTQFREALEPEFEIIFRSRSERYMIIKYKDSVSFQKCGIGNGSRETLFKNIRELADAPLIDGVSLRSAWDDIEDIIVDSSLSLTKDFEAIAERGYLKL